MPTVGQVLGIQRLNETFSSLVIAYSLAGGLSKQVGVIALE